MRNATHNCIRRFLPLLILVGMAFSTSTVLAGVNIRTIRGPEGTDIQAFTAKRIL